MTPGEPARKFEGYSWYYSGAYTCWMLVSPVSGFYSPFPDEASCIRFVAKESGKNVHSEIGCKNLSSQAVSKVRA